MHMARRTTSYFKVPQDAVVGSIEARFVAAVDGSADGGPADGHVELVNGTVYLKLRVASPVKRIRRSLPLLTTTPSFNFDNESPLAWGAAAQASSYAEDDTITDGGFMDIVKNCDYVPPMYT